ncbi:hypothetical protein FQR65_LT06922 [Abscondita terminalis]|nr:hypothetical protein FQR65_LT06922 [Abscondita terminalis]
MTECRMCLIEIKENLRFYSLNDELELHNKLLWCFPELDLTVTQNPIACEQCNDMIEQIHRFKTTCLQNENTLKARRPPHFEDILIKNEPIKSEEPSPDFLYYCYHCNYATNNQKILTDHIFNSCLKNTTVPIDTEVPMSNGSYADASNRSSGRAFKCKLCDDMVKNGNDLKQHFAYKHSGEWPYKCGTCDFKTLYKGNLTMHERRHKKEKSYRCEKCDYEGYTKGNLMQHEKKHTEEKPFKCNWCDYSTKFLHTLKVHLFNHTKRNHSNEYRFNCIKCDYKTQEKITFEKHLQTHNDEKQFKCELCDYSGREFRNLKWHMYKHNDNWPFKCNICDFRTGNKANLIIHIRVHTGEKPFKCKSCSFSTGLKCSLKKHQKAHH